jgi:hypothetical protein
MITLIFQDNLCVGWGEGLRPSPNEQSLQVPASQLDMLLPSWRSNSSFLMLDENNNVTTQIDKLNDVKQIALADVEFLFDRILALGMRYDFGAAGIAAKANDARTQGGTVSFTTTLEHPHSNISFSVAPDDGYLHIQARLRDRSTLQQTFAFVQQLVDRGVTDPLAFQSTENILIPLTLADYDAVTFALGQWYSAKFYELQIHKLSIRNMTSIQDVVSYQPTFTPN